MLSDEAIEEFMALVCKDGRKINIDEAKIEAQRFFDGLSVIFGKDQEK